MQNTRDDVSYKTSPSGHWIELCMYSRSTPLSSIVQHALFTTTDQIDNRFQQDTVQHHIRRVLINSIASKESFKKSKDRSGFGFEKDSFKVSKMIQIEIRLSIGNQDSQYAKWPPDQTDVAFHGTNMFRLIER